MIIKTIILQFLNSSSSLAQLKEEFELSYVNWVGSFCGKKILLLILKMQNFGASQHPLLS
jgi:hypothetical protein